SLDFYTELLREGKALDEFIEGHLEKAPIQVERAGISKGDSLPFPRTKTHAALLHLKLQGELTSLQQLARQADISYRLLGKWRTEKRFQDAITHYEAEFALLIVTFVFAWIKDSYDFKIPGVARALAIIPDLKDVSRWSPRLRRIIFSALLSPESFGQRFLLVPVDRLVAGHIALAIHTEFVPEHGFTEDYRRLRGLF